MTATEKAQVMIGFDQGRKVEFSRVEYDAWDNCINPTWDWRNFNYRLKPEPIECWVCVYAGKIGGYIYHTKKSAVIEFNASKPERIAHMVEAPE